MSQIRLYSQCDPRWANKRYSSSGTGTFRKYGCLVTALASLATYAGYDVDPPTFAKKIDEAGAFEGNFLNHSEKVTVAFPKLVWRKAIDWSTTPADLNTVKQLLAKNPTIFRVDYKPATPEVNSHFVLGLEYITGEGIEDRMRVMDTLTGTETELATYFEPKWNYESAIQQGRTTRVKRTLMGARIWEILDGSAPTKIVRGVHGVPINALPQDPPGDPNWWLAELQAMRIKWFKTMSLNTTWLRTLMSKGITPIVRLYQHRQFPSGLNDAQLGMIKLLISAGVVYFEIGNEPNLPDEWQLLHLPFFSWKRDSLVRRVGDTFITDARKLIALGGKPAFYAMAPTDVGGTNQSCSSVMWTRRVLNYLASHYKREIKQWSESGQVWIAVHVSPFTRDFDFEPDQGTYIDDMCLRGYEPTYDLWQDLFGTVPDMISTEGGVFSPTHMRYLNWEPNYTDETWGQKQVEMFEWLEKYGKLTAMCPWTLSDSGLNQDSCWMGSGWYGRDDDARSPVEAMKG